MISIIKKFLSTDIDNLVWGLLGALAIIILVWFTRDKQTAMALGGAFIGVCLNKMRGKGEESTTKPLLGNQK